MGALGFPARSTSGVSPERGLPDRSASALDQVFATLLDGSDERAHTLLRSAYDTALRTTPLTDDAFGEALLATRYAAAVVVELAARADLAATDTQVVIEALADGTNTTPSTASFAFYEQIVTSPTLLELPPPTAVDIQLQILIHLGCVHGVSVWQVDGGALTPVLHLGQDLPMGRARSAAKAALRERAPLIPIGARATCAVPLRRFSIPVGALVAEPRKVSADVCNAYLAVAARAVALVLEREQLLDRGAAREATLTQSLEKRLMRIGFDLHDGPVQDVVALRAELRLLARDLYPFVADSHRYLAAGRFDDLDGRISEIDAGLRELAHSLESRTITSRPLGETLHRAIDEFKQRHPIAARLEVVGDPEAMTSAQRIAVFRAIQESLTNVREHSGATEVSVTLRTRRNSVEVEVEDNGHGFDVEREIVLAAQRGRLGVVGMGERVRLLGGTFSISSRVGGPTTLRIVLPRLDVADKN